MAEGVPLAYLITFTSYGARMHGDPNGSVDRVHNVYGTPGLFADAKRTMTEASLMRQHPYELAERERVLVLEAIRQVCSYKRWVLRAAHVRSNHVHFVVTADERPERVLNTVKAYASRALNRKGVSPAWRRWSRHGSTRYLWKPESVGAAIHYVVTEQGEPMAVWQNPAG